MRLVGMKFEILSPLKCLRARNFRNFQLENLMEIKLTKFDDSTVFTAHLLINFAIIISIFCGLLNVYTIAVDIFLLHLLLLPKKAFFILSYSLSLLPHSSHIIRQTCNENEAM